MIRKGRRGVWWLRGVGWLGENQIPATITAIYLGCGLLWMIIAVTFVNHGWAMVVEDAIFIVCTAVLLRHLVRLGVGVVRAKESALRESEDRLARILDTNASGIIVFDEKGKISYVNNAAMRILGGDRSEMIGLRYDEPSWHLTDADGSPLRPELNPVVLVQVGRLPVYDVEVGAMNRDGRRVFLTVNAAPLLDASGKTVGIVASFGDITERKKAVERKFRKLHLAMEQSPSAIVITDLDGNEEYANPRYAMLGGCTVREILSGDTPHQCMVPAGTLEEMRTAVRSGNAWRGEFECHRCPRKEGTRYWESTSVSPIRSAEGEKPNLLWVREDITERKEAEAALRCSEANYRAVVEDQTEFICRFRPDGILTFVNGAYCRTFEKAQGELVGTPFPYPGEEKHFLKAARRHAFQDRNHPPIEYESQVTVSGGEVRWQRWTERAVFDAAGNFVEFQAVGSDVTEHRQADIALRESQEKFQNLVETIFDWVWETDQAGVYTYVSPRIRDLLGYAPEEVIGKTPFDFMSASEAARVRGIFGAISARREPFAGVENVNRHKDGRDVIIETSAAPFFDSDGGFRGYRGVDRDVGERKRAEELVRASEERFRQMFEQNEEPIFLFREGAPGILDANPAAVDLYGFPREELLREGLALFVPPEDLEKFSSSIAGIRSIAPLSIVKMRHRRKGGEGIVVSVRAKSIRTREGHVVYCSFRDISARIRMEQEAKMQQAQLIHANRMASLGAIVSGVAHEVNNPNNLIMFNAPMILSAWEDALPVMDRYRRESGDFTVAGLPYTEMRDVVPRLAAGISDASTRIKAIVANLKNFARQDESRGHRPERINDIVRSAVGILNHEIMKGTHDFRVDFGEDLPPVMGLSQQLEQVVINLLHNALQALPSSRRAIRLSTSRNPDTGDVEVHVVDEGVGMPREVLERITEPFFSTRLDSGGLGLGLSICMSIVKGHGGTLCFESEVGKGTRAIVQLPALKSLQGDDADHPELGVPAGR